MSLASAMHEDMLDWLTLIVSNRLFSLIASYTYVGTNASPLFAIPPDVIFSGLALAGIALSEATPDPLSSESPISAAANSRRKSILQTASISVWFACSAQAGEKGLHRFQQSCPTPQISFDSLAQFLQQNVEGVTVGKHLHDLLEPCGQ
jgi:hypothetical protein